MAEGAMAKMTYYCSNMNSNPDLPTAVHLPPEIPIHPIGHPVDLDIAVPGSKSISNRYLVMGALADGEATISGLLHCDDTHYMTESLKTLGFQTQTDWKNQTCRIKGEGGFIPVKGCELFASGSGTLMRFIAAFVTLGNGRFRLDGNERMRQRPIEDLLQGLRLMGVNAYSEFSNQCPPVIVEARGLPGGATSIDGSRSSQYISALLLVAPYALKPMRIEVTGNFVSRPYVELTLKCMSDFGVSTLNKPEDYRHLQPAHGVKYRAGHYDVEGDASAASYFLAAAAILGGRCCVTNVDADSAQGDSRFADVLQQMGCSVRKGFLSGNRGIEVSRDVRNSLRPIQVDMNDMPDVVMTLASVCLFAEGTSSIRNVGNLRIKETDRLAALSNELRRMGASIKEENDALEITPRAIMRAKIETYDDHRMAMAMSLVGLSQSGICIKNPACVSKSYPLFFTDLEKLR